MGLCDGMGCPHQVIPVDGPATVHPTVEAWASVKVPLSWTPPVELTQQKTTDVVEACATVLEAVADPANTYSSVLHTLWPDVHARIEEVSGIGDASLSKVVAERLHGQPPPDSFMASMLDPHPLCEDDARLFEGLTNQPGLFAAAGLIPGASKHVLIAWHPQYKRMWAWQVAAFGSVEAALEHAMGAADIGVREMVFLDATMGLPPFQLQIGAGAAKLLYRIHLQKYGPVITA